MSDIVLIHGCWCHPENARPLERALRARGHRVHVPALPGRRGGREIGKKELARLSLRDCARELRREIEEQRFESPPVLIGHSMGGLLAQMIASEIPVGGLVLLNSAGPAGVNHIYPSSVRSTWSILTRPFFWLRVIQPSRRNADHGLLNRVPDEKAAEIYDSLVPESGRIFFELVFWFLDRRQGSRIRRSIEAPILIVGGGMDRIVAPRVARALLRRYPLASFRFFPASGHWLFHEIGQRRVFDEIGDWIDTLCERQGLPEGRAQGHHEPHRTGAGEKFVGLPESHAGLVGEPGAGEPCPEACGSASESEGEHPARKA